MNIFFLFLAISLPLIVFAFPKSRIPWTWVLIGFVFPPVIWAFGFYHRFNSVWKACILTVLLLCSVMTMAGSITGLTSYVIQLIIWLTIPVIQIKKNIE